MNCVFPLVRSWNCKRKRSVSDFQISAPRKRVYMCVCVCVCVCVSGSGGTLPFAFSLVGVNNCRMSFGILLAWIFILFFHFPSFSFAPSPSQPPDTTGQRKKGTHLGLGFYSYYSYYYYYYWQSIFRYTIYMEHTSSRLLLAAPASKHILGSLFRHAVKKKEKTTNQKIRKVHCATRM